MKLTHKMNKNTLHLISRLEGAGFTIDEALKLRRIQMTLRRWFELECGDSNQWASWAIERDPDTDKPHMVRYPHNGKSYRTAIPDREYGARKRLAKIMEAHPDHVSYIQTDPRGCALYIVAKSDVGDHSLDSVYTRGIAVCA